MRIVGGIWSGRPLAGLGEGDDGARLRPTKDRVRESLFNILAHGRAGVEMEGIGVLDLFAGTGALGLEALSRGAAEAVFVENGRIAQGLLAENVRRLGAENRSKILKRDATRPGVNEGRPRAGLVFMDPPYGTGLGARALAAVRDGGWLEPGALIVWEDAAQQSAPEGFSAIDHRRFGSTHVTFLRAD